MYFWNEEDDWVCYKTKMCSSSKKDDFVDYPKYRKAKEEYNLNVKVINAMFIKPVDEKLLTGLVENNYNILVMEDGIVHGGLYSMVLEKLNQLGYSKKVERLGFDDKFIEQGTVPELYAANGITKESIKKIVDELNNR